MDDIISLGVGEPDFVTPWNVREYAMFTLERGDTSYTSNKGILALRREIAGYMAHRFGVTYDPENEVLVTVGASQGLDLSMRAILNPGDEAIVIEPSYVAYKPMVALAGGVPVVVTLRYENNFRLDLAELRAAVTPRTRAILLNYPSNPTGGTFTKEECRHIAALAEEYDLILISDEIYAEMTYDQEHYCMADQPGARDRTIVLNGFSKAFAMTGWRMGFAAGPADLIAGMTKIFQYSMLSAPIMSQNAAIEALRKRHQNVPHMVETFNQRRRLFVEGLRAIGIDCHMPEGAFYAYPCIRKFGLSSREFCTRLLKEERIAVVPGTAFGPAGEGFVRCAYAAGFQELEQALEGMKNLIGRL
ncbi:aminotransferase class I/II-fold pyridoxal phosphate-dependent enzyme [bacterium]|nr:aminotransferase class I/II-fold pyridoxal phosphate-dependent enzyme [bacterium]